MAADIFSSPKRRIARAKKNIAGLDAQIQSFFNKKPYASVVEADAQGINNIHKIKIINPIPDALIDETVGAAEELRSALDQAVYATIVATGKTSRNIFFPIASSETDLDSVIKRGKDIPPDIVTLCRSFKPYKGGNDLIWALNETRNGTTHRLLVPVGVAIGNSHLKHMRCPGLVVEMTFPPQWNTEKDELVFAVIGPNTHIEYEMQLNFLIAFNEIDFIRGQPAVPVLNAMTSEVERIVLTIESESIRLGLV
jgi:hypothetical protein